MEVELLKMLPGGGSAAALIITVILFLKQQEKANLNLNAIIEKFNAQVAASQASFQSQINNVMSQSLENQKMYQNQIQALIDGHLEVAHETIEAIQSLESAVRELQGRVQPPARASSR